MHNTMPNTNTIPAIITAQWLRSQGADDVRLGSWFTDAAIEANYKNFCELYVNGCNIDWFIAYLGCEIWTGRDIMSPINGDIVYQPLVDLRDESLENKYQELLWWHLACQTAIPFIVSRVATP